MTAARHDDTPPRPKSAHFADLGTVERGTTLTDQTYERLRRALLVGALKPGDKITGRQISKTLGVSLTPAREAIIRLANEGALEGASNRAFTVPILTRPRYEEILEIRLRLESLAASEAARRSDKAFIAELEEKNEAVARFIQAEDFAHALERDTEFHFAIYARAGKPVLLSMIDMLWLQIGPTRSLLSPGYQRGLKGHENHKAIISALAAGDPEAAGAAVAKDLREGGGYLLMQLGD